MNLDIWAFEETSAEATQALVDYLRDAYHLDFACDFSEPDAPSDKQTTTVMWNQKTVTGRKEEWPVYKGPKFIDRSHLPVAESGANLRGR